MDNQYSILKTSCSVTSFHTAVAVFSLLTALKMFASFFRGDAADILTPSFSDFQQSGEELGERGFKMSAARSRSAC